MLSFIDPELKKQIGKTKELKTSFLKNKTLFKKVNDSLEAYLEDFKEIFEDDELIKLLTILNPKIRSLLEIDDFDELLTIFPNLYDYK